MNIINSNMTPNVAGYGAGYIPPSPIGSTLNLGGLGYNNQMQTNTMQTMGGYYNPYGGTIYNPYLMRQQQERAMAIQRQQMEQQANIMKSLSRIVNSSMSDDEFEEYSKVYQIQYEPNEEQQYIQQQNKFDMMAHYNPEQHRPVDPRTIRNIYLINQEIDKQKSRFPDDMSLPEYLEVSGDLLYEAFIEEGTKKQRDMSRTYNSQKYRDLIDIHSNATSYFNTLYSQAKIRPNVTIDDMEVRLPKDLENSEYHQRQRKFVQQLMQGGGI